MDQIEIIHLFSPAKPVEMKGVLDNDPPVFENIEVHVLKNARINYYGYVFKNGRVHEHFISPRHRGTVTWKNRLANYFKKKVVSIDYPVISVAHGWYDNYYHFTLEVLIKIYLLSERYPETTIIFPKKLSSFHKSWFEILEINNLLFIEENQLILSPKVISCNFPNRDLNHHDIITPLFRKWILDKVKKHGVLDDPKFNKKLFIDREKAAYRKVINHQEVFQKLKDSEFQVVNLEELTVLDQINAMYFATEIKFVHGAGLTNILFCKPNTKIIDFCHKDFNQLCFMKLAKTLDLTYENISCEGNQVHELPGYCDLYIPLIELSNKNYD